MKISFSTLGCPEWSWEDMLVTAKDLSFDGIEVRGIENEMYVPKTKPFLPENISSTRARLARMNLEIPCLTSSCCLFDKSNIEWYKNEGREYVDAAQAIGASYVRVLGDPNPEPGIKIDLDYTANNIKELAAYASNRKVVILVETNGYFANSSNLLKLLNKVNNPNVGVLWDIHHPYRFFNETVEYTYKMLKNHIKFVHIKDSIIENNKVRYKMMGYGDVPVKEALLLLKNAGYQGYVSLEWVKRWCIDLEEPGVVFSHFINYIRGIII